MLLALARVRHEDNVVCEREDRDWSITEVDARGEGLDGRKKLVEDYIEEEGW